MLTIIVGCGRMGSMLAWRLQQAGAEIAVVDNNPASLRNLHPEFHGRTIVGEIFSEEIFRRAGIERAQGFAAMTNSDPVNAAIAHVAQSVFNVPHVVARNYDPRFLPLHEAFGHEVVSTVDWGVRQFEASLLGHAADGGA